MTAPDQPADGPKCETCKDTGQVCVGTSGQDADGNAPVLERCPECGYGDGPKSAEAWVPPAMHQEHKKLIEENAKFESAGAAVDALLSEADRLVANYTAYPSGGFVDLITRLAAALRQRQQEQGAGVEWKLVPVIPTEQMIEAAWEAPCGQDDTLQPEDVWPLMLAAAPQPPVVKP